MINNIFGDIPASLPEELLEVISKNDNVSIERIVSRGHASPEEFWYDQEKNEFVLLLKGSAGLSFEDREGITVLRPGDYLHIPSHMKHRVEWTSTEGDTVWLAVHF